MERLIDRLSQLESELVKTRGRNSQVFLERLELQYTSSDDDDWLNNVNDDLL